MKIKKKHYKALQYASLIQRWRYLSSNFIFEVVQNSEVDEVMLNRNRIEQNGKRIRRNGLEQKLHI
jgi:hypothetical protein